jgi:hypothetical protein
VLVQLLLELAKEANEDGARVFPVWGTCLGFEFLLQFFGGAQDLHGTCRFDLLSALIDAILDPTIAGVETRIRAIQ